MCRVVQGLAWVVDLLIYRHILMISMNVMYAKTVFAVTDEFIAG